MATAETSSGFSLDRLLQTAADVYVQTHQSSPAEQVANAPAEQQAGLNQTPLPNNVNASPAVFSLAGVSVDRRVLIATGVILAGLLAYKAIK